MRSEIVKCPTKGLGLPNFDKMEYSTKYMYNTGHLLAHNLVFLLEKTVKKAVDSGKVIVWEKCIRRPDIVYFRVYPLENVNYHHISNKQENLQ